MIICAFASTLFGQQPLASNAKPGSALHTENSKFNWSQTSFDFGKIKVNNPVTHEFSFLNAGEAPLVITSVQASCGCTVTKYTKNPLTQAQQGM